MRVASKVTVGRVLIAILAVVLLLVLAVWLTLPQLVERIGRNRLEAAGFQDVELSVQRSTWRRFVLDGIAVAARGDNAWQLRAEDIDAEYRLPQLLRGKLDSVSVRRAELRVMGGESTEPVELGAVFDWLRRPWHALIPLDHLTIESLSVTPAAATGSDRIEVRVDAIRADEVIDVRLGMRGAGGAFRDARVRWARGGKTVLRLMPADGAVIEPLSLTMTVLDPDRGVQGTLTASSQELAQWLAPFTDASSDVRGALSVDFSMRPDSASTVTFDAQVTIVDGSAMGAAVDVARLRLDAAAVHSGNTVLLRTRADAVGEIDKLRLGDLLIADAQVAWSGQLTAGPDGIAIETESGTRIQIAKIESGAAAADALDATVVGRYRWGDREFTAQLTDPIVMRAGTRRLGDAHVRKPDVIVAGSLHKTQNETRIALQRGSRVRIAGVRWGELESDATAVSLSGRYLHDGVGGTATIESGSRVFAENIRGPDWQIVAATATLPGSLEHTAADTVYVVEPAGEVSVTGLEFAGLKLEEAVIVPADGQRLRWRSGGGAADFDTGRWRATLSPMRIDRNRLTMDSLDLELSWHRGTDSRLTARLATAAAELQAQSFGIAATDLAADIGIAPDEISGAVHFASHGARFDADVYYRSNDDTGRVDFVSAPFDLAAKETPLSRFLQPWPFDFDLVSGAIRSAGKVWWDGGGPDLLLGARIDLGLDGTGGFYGPVVFSGLSTELALDVVPELRTRSSARIKLDSVDFGIIMNDLSAGLDIKPSPHGDEVRYSLHELGASFLGGRVVSEKIDYDPNLSSNELSLRVRSIDLQDLVTLHAFEGLDATGKLDGTLPVTVGAEGVSVDQGEFHGLPPGGHIRYRSDAGAGELEDPATGTGMVMEVLRDFNYEVLDAQVDYAEDGALHAAVHLEGTSGALEDGRPVHLNVNLEQNLLALLKSLRVVGGLNAALDKHVRDYYEAQHGAR